MSVLTKVLVVDDSEEDFLHLRDLFRSRRNHDSWRFYLEHVHTTAEARARLNVDNWSFLVVDHYLGGVETGLDFIYRLHDEGRRLPALLLSGATDIPVQPRTVAMIQTGHLHFLPKNDLCWESLRHVIADKICRRFRVLIVDDDPEDIEIFRDTLQDGDFVRFEIDTASTLAEARSSLETGDYEVLLLDYRLQQERGTDLLFDTVESRIPGLAILCTGQEAFDLDHRTVQMIGKGRLRFFSKASLDGKSLFETVLSSTRKTVWADGILPGALLHADPYQPAQDLAAE